MQTTLDCNKNPTSLINVEAKNSTLEMSDEHIEHLYQTSSMEEAMQYRIEQHIEEERNKTEEYKEEFEYLQQFPEFRPQTRKPQKFTRVGRRC